jgi:hypothetical protein
MLSPARCQDTWLAFCTHAVAQHQRYAAKAAAQQLPSLLKPWTKQQLAAAVHAAPLKAMRLMQQQPNTLQTKKPRSAKEHACRHTHDGATAAASALRYRSACRHMTIEQRSASCCLHGVRTVAPRMNCMLLVTPTHSIFLEVPHCKYLLSSTYCVANNQLQPAIL